jgi:hypothetical protein
MQKILTLCFVCILFFSCEKEEPTPVTYFEIEIDEEYLTDETDDWIVLHDNSDHLLAARHFESGEKIVFDSTVIVDEKFNVSLFRHTKVDGDYFTVESYVGVEPAQSWTVLPTFPTIEHDLGADVGQILISMADPGLGSPYNVMVSNKYFDIAPGIIADATVSFTQSLQKNNDDLFVFATDKNANPKYLFLENLSPGSKTLSLQDLADFEKNVTTNFPQPTTFSYAFVRGYDVGDRYVVNEGYMTNFYFHGISGGVYSGYKLGFTNRFTTYSINIFAYAGPYDVSYESLGPAPSGNIDLTKANVQISNQTFSAFAVTGTDFDWRKSYFLSGPTAPRTAWYIHSSKDDLSNPKLPAVFAQRFPTFSNGNLPHSSTQFNSGFNYVDFLAEKFAGADRKFRVMRSTVLR